MVKKEEEETEEEQKEETPEEAFPRKEEKELKMKAVDLINKTNEAAERLEQANKKYEQLIEETAKLKLEKTFEGKADAGEGKKGETPEEYKNKIMRGEL